MKDFQKDGRLGTSGEGGEPIRAIPTCRLVHSPTSVLMFARGWREAATKDAAKAGKSKKIKLLKK
jgi:hypothetical protein